MSPLLVLAPVARVAAIAAGWMLMVVSAATVVEIVGRKLFGFSLRGIDEVSGYALAIVGTIGFSYSLIVRSHMRIALLHGWLPRWARALLDVTAAVTLAAMALFCAWRGYVELAASIESLKPANTPLRTPLWIPQTFWFAGLAFFAVATLSAAVHAIVLAFTDTARLTRLYGPAAIEEEVKAEVSQLETRLGATGPGGAPAVIDIGGVAIGFGLMLLMMALGIHIATVMFALGALGAALYLGMPAVNALGVIYFESMNDPLLLALPLFILVGEILVRCGATDQMYRSLADWLNPLPGGLLHTNIASSALFSAVSGSSVATAATIATVALPSFRQRSYDTRLVLGSIAAGGSLGNLIPPGIAFIIYGVLTNTSVARLYAGATLPGIVLTLMFMATIAAIAVARPSSAPRETVTDPLGVRVRRLTGLLAPIFIFALIMVSIYAGWATATESAALAVIASLPIAAMYRKLSIRMLHDAFLATVNLTALSLLILAGAFALNFVLGLLGATRALTGYVTSLNLEPTTLLWVLFGFYALLGTFMETLPMMVGTLPLVFPVIKAAGIDPVFFGVFIVLMCELSLISPPVGMTLYVIQAVRREGSITDVFRGTLPFIVTMLLMTVLLIYWPKMVMWLPGLFFDK